MSVRKLCKINKDLLIYKAFYFFFYGALGTINPFLPVYFRQIGLSAIAVGLLVGIRPIIQFASAPFWTVMADKFKKRKSILVMSVIAWLVMTISLVFVEPTEEICQLTANNLTHSLFVNYTSFKTGFFKRSNEKSQGLHGLQITDETELKTIPVTTSVGFPHPYTKKFNKITETSKTGWATGFPHIKPTLLKYQRSIDKSALLNGNRQIRTKTTSVFVRKSQPNETQRKHKTSVIADRSFKFVSKRSSTGSHHATTSDVDNKTTDTFISYKPITTEGTIGPYNNMTSSQLANFFSNNSQRNKGTKATIDAHYYNMNGPYPEPNNRKNISLASTQLKLDEKITSRMLKKIYSNVTTNASVVIGKNISNSSSMVDINDVSQKNKTQTITQRNLFKANTNEMKRHFVILLILIVVGEFLETPAMPVSDASLLEYLGEDRIYYGKQRLWGSLGHGISSFLVGILLEHSRHLTCGEEFIDYTICFCAFTLFMLSNLVTTANFKFTYNEVEEKTHSVLSTVLTVHYISFLGGAFYMGMCHGFLHNFIMWFVEDLGGSKTLMGLAIGCRCCADLITFFVASLLIEYLGQIKIVFIALVSYGAIFIAYSSMTNPWFALGVEFLEGFTYAASWSACTSYLAEAAPKESVATMQGVLQGVYYGLGTGMGAILGGHMIHTLGAYSTFRFAATGSFIVASLFAVTQWKWPREDLNESLGIYDYFSTGEPKDTEALLKVDKDEHSQEKNDKRVAQHRKHIVNTP